MPPPVFPLALVNDLDIEITKTPTFAIRKQVSVDGHQLRVLDQPLPIWEFKLTAPFLPDGSDKRVSIGGGRGTGATDLRNLMGFFLSLQGGFGEFYFIDPTDNVVTAQAVGTGDGATVAFQLLRSMGIGSNVFNEPIYGINTSAPFNVYLNGALQSPSAYSVNNQTGVLLFVSAPGNTVIITVDFSYYFLVTFDEDNMDFKYFLYQLWSVDGIKLRSQLL